MYTGEKILIWGTGEYGKRTYQRLSRANEYYQVVYWGDNNIEKIGTQIYDLKVLGLNDVNCLPKDEIDAIVIASQYSNEIYEELKQHCNTKLIYKDVTELKNMPVKYAYIEISGKCNALCSYCFTGNQNKSKTFQLSGGRYFEFAKFEKTIAYMMAERMIDEWTNINLYNWGEPFLHPQLEDILIYLNKIGLHDISLSTNASVVRNMKKEALEVVKNIIISMPGFSQESYNRIHGFDFERIKKNVCDLKKNFERYNLSVNMLISFHLYQFNIFELPKAAAWAKQLGISMNPNFAFMNDFRRGILYCEGKLPYDEVLDMGKELCLYKSTGKDCSNEICNQNRILTVNEEGELLLCCGVSRDCETYSLGSIMQMKAETVWDIKKQAMQSTVCNRCKGSGLFDWATSTRLSMEEAGILLGDRQNVLIPDYFNS